ncbi:DUF167-domain-containing protein [Aspergillus karnatakaensis]|uniref:DUF167 domain-containing protein n=1 Tax=Aspergillus karnatakaensis TaxID=1810916 RepID=UPI003CCDA199
MSTPIPMLRLIQAATTASRRTPNPTTQYNLQISCRVKPNAAGNREGIVSVGPETVYVCVAAVPRDGEANAAVSRVFAKVLGVAKSDVDVVKGLKSRDKVISVAGLVVENDSEEQFLEKVRKQLETAWEGR